VILRLATLLVLAWTLSAQPLETCRQHYRSGRLQQSVNCYRPLAGSADPYLRAEANWALRRFKEANDAFRAAVQNQPKNPDYRVRWGRLYLDREQNADAAGLFNEALEIKDNHAGALLGMALVASQSYEGTALELAQKALASDPKLVEAQVLLASMALEDNNPEKANQEADRALAIDSDSLEALAVKATIDLLDDKADTPNVARILKLNPAYGELYSVAGRFFVLNRRYEEGIALYRKALDLNPQLYDARAALGLNLMRLGHEDEARKHLTACFEAGETYPAVGNPLRLLDSYKNFRFIKSGNIVLKLHTKEAGLLAPYFEAETRRAITTYEKKYQMRLDRPVQVEVYPDHEDFAVRILGMPGMGALGVTFVNVVAMDSPTSRRPGDYHWASTLWHELSHVFTLAATRQRMPRWFTEGMAVYEETAASPEWGDRLSPHVILAIRDKKLLPVAQLDRGFVHPTYPDQVVVSYFQAGRICNFIERKWGFQKLLGMMRAFGELKTTDQVIQEQLAISPEEFDKQFLAALTAETKTTVEGFDDWKKGMQRLAELVKGEKDDDLIREAPAIRDLYPEFVESGNVYEVLAGAYLAKGDKSQAAAELTRYAKAGGRSPEAIKRLAALLDELKRPREAIAALTRLNYIYPGDEELHRRLGDLRLAEGDAEGAIREYQAQIAMGPFDKAASHFNLARAYRMAEKREEAKEQVLLSLEAAPGYRPAQKMLLELSQ
jgi:cellulose synthase operon protein C